MVYDLLLWVSSIPLATHFAGKNKYMFLSSLIIWIIGYITDIYNGVIIMKKEYWKDKLDASFTWNFSILLHILVLFLCLSREIIFLFAMIISRHPMYNPLQISSQSLLISEDNLRNESIHYQQIHSNINAANSRMRQFSLQSEASSDYTRHSSSHEAVPSTSIQSN